MEQVCVLAVDEKSPPQVQFPCLISDIIAVIYVFQDNVTVRETDKKHRMHPSCVVGQWFTAWRFWSPDLLIECREGV